MQASRQTIASATHIRSRYDPAITSTSHVVASSLCNHASRVMQSGRSCCCCSGVALYLLHRASAPDPHMPSLLSACVICAVRFLSLLWWRCLLLLLLLAAFLCCPQLRPSRSEGRNGHFRSYAEEHKGWVWRVHRCSGRANPKQRTQRT